MRAPRQFDELMIIIECLQTSVSVLATALGEDSINSGKNALRYYPYQSNANSTPCVMVGAGGCVF